MQRVQTSFLHQLKHVTANQSGATAVEYGLLIGLVAIGLAGGLGALADLVNLLFEFIGDGVGNVTTTTETEGG